MIVRAWIVPGLLCASLTAAPADAQWMQNGVPVYPGGLQQDTGVIRSDGRGGAYVVWRERRIEHPETDSDNYIQHITAGGFVDPAWSIGGLALAVAARTQGSGVPVIDADGAAFVSWEDGRNNSTDIYSARVLPSGVLAPGWAVGGIPICVDPAYQRDPLTCLDGTGGVYIIWSDDRHEQGRPRIYWTHLTATGELVPGWPPNGRPYLESLDTRYLLQTLPTGTGGLFVLWADLRGATPFGLRIYVTLTLPDGSLAPGWPVDGAVLTTSGTVTEVTKIATDGAGGVYVGWNENRFGSPNPIYDPNGYDLHAQHVRFDGTIDPRWPVDGLPVCNAPNGQYDFDLESDGSGGAFFFWQDYRNGPAQVYGQRLHADGSIAAGWAVQGRPLSTSPEHKSTPRAVPDGQGGLYGTWEQTNPTTGRGEIHAQHVRADGSLAPGWLTSGLPIAAAPTTSFRDAVSVQPDGAGGVLLAYQASSATGLRIHAHRIGNDGPVATRVALLDAVVHDGEVVVRWQSSDAANLRASVERRTESEDWIIAGTAQLEGTDRLVHRESGLTPGRHAFRLRYVEDGVDQVSEPTWVEVEAVAAFRLEGFRPNPARAGVAVAFALPDAGPATILVHDARGRIVHRREVGDRGAGSHVVRVDEGASLPAGIYWVRLVRSGATLQAKGVVIR